MPDYPCHQSLRLQNFTVFADAAFDFSPGVNAFVGENGSGKTHLLKAMYAYQRSPSRDVPDLRTTLLRLFQTDDVASLMRVVSRGVTLKVSGRYDENSWDYTARKPSSDVYTSPVRVKMAQPVFIPAMDMMGHTQQFDIAYNRYFLDFDLTCYDIVTLFRDRPSGATTGRANTGLGKLLGGEIEEDKESGRFYLTTEKHKRAMPMVAEGLRKIASLIRLQDNKWLVPGTALYWDEPETNINPVLMDELIGAILTMARQGVQVFLTTHSYVILKELDLQAKAEDKVRYFGLQPGKQGTVVSATDDFALLEPNPILRQYDSLYDRELTRATGRNQNGERIR